MNINTVKLELLTVQQGLNFSQLAEKADVSKQTISTIKGRRTCAATTACKLAKALSVDVMELIDTEQEAR